MFVVEIIIIMPSPLFKRQAYKLKMKSIHKNGKKGKKKTGTNKQNKFPSRKGRNETNVGVSREREE